MAKQKCTKCTINDNLTHQIDRLTEENAELKARLEKSVTPPVAMGEECYIIKIAETTTIEKAVALFPCLATESKSGKQIMHLENVRRTRKEAEQALEWRNKNNE